MLPGIALFRSHDGRRPGAGLPVVRFRRPPRPPPSGRRPSPPVTQSPHDGGRSASEAQRRMHREEQGSRSLQTRGPQQPSVAHQRRPPASPTSVAHQRRGPGGSPHRLPAPPPRTVVHLDGTVQQAPGAPAGDHSGPVSPICGWEEPRRASPPVGRRGHPMRHRPPAPRPKSNNPRTEAGVAAIQGPLSLLRCPCSRRRNSARWRWPGTVPSWPSYPSGCRGWDRPLCRRSAWTCGRPPWHP